MRKKKVSNMSHEFALFYNETFKVGTTFIADQDLIHRIMHVLRMKQHDTIIVFNKKQSAQFLFDQITSKKITGTLSHIKNTASVNPSITLLLPVLKKEALSEAIYGVVEVGVSSIQLIITEKVQRKWQGQKELDRLQRVIIAAAEQSKNFALPQLLAPLSFQDMLISYKDKKIVCADPDGKLLMNVKKEDVAVIVGPEGGLTDKELSQLKRQNIEFYRLTSTILRARQAAILFVGFLRSI